MYGTLVSGRIIVCFPQMNESFFLITNMSATFERMGRPSIEICLKVGHSFDHPI